MLIIIDLNNFVSFVEALKKGINPLTFIVFIYVCLVKLMCRIIMIPVYISKFGTMHRKATGEAEQGGQEGRLAPYFHSHSIGL